jgi:hypothetical protein
LLYDLEFVRFVDDNFKAVTPHSPVKLIGNTVPDVIVQADKLLETVALVPRPDGYRLRAANGTVVCVSGGPRSNIAASPDLAGSGSAHLASGRSLSKMYEGG